MPRAGTPDAEEIGEFLEGLSLGQRVLATRIRSIIKRSIPGVVETMKWGNPTYLLEGKNVAWILVYGDHLDLGLFAGARLSSPLLEGTGKGLRRIKVRSASDINEKEFSRLLEAGAKLA